MIKLVYKLYFRITLAFCLVVLSAYTMETESEQANRFYKAGYEILDELEKGSKTLYDSTIYNPRAIEMVKSAEENFQRALELHHPYAAMALKEVYYNPHMRKIEKTGKLEEALLKSIHYKSKNHIRAGYLQDVDMLMWIVKSINPQSYSLQDKKVISPCSKVINPYKSEQTDYLGGLHYMETVCPERAIAIYGKLASFPENEHAEAALEALYRLSATWSSCYVELSLACFNREKDEEGLAWLEKDMKADKATDLHKEWLEKCVWYDKERDYYGSLTEPLKKETCFEILVKKRNNKDMPLSFRLNAARLISEHGDKFQESFSYLVILQESRKFLDCRSEIDRITLHILKQSETDKQILSVYTPFFKKQLIEENGMDPTSLIWNTNQENFVEAYHMAADCFGTLDAKLKMNLDMCLDLYMRAVKLRFGMYKVIEGIMNTPILLVHKLSNFALFLAKESPNSLPVLSEYTHNPVFSCIGSLIGSPKLSQYDLSVMRGWELSEHIETVSKTVHEYAPQYDVTLHENEYIFNPDANTKVKLQKEGRSGQYVAQSIQRKRDQLIDSLSAEEQFDMAMEYELINVCLNECNKPSNSIYGSYIHCLWLSATKGYTPASQELAHLYAKGDKQHFVQTYLLTQEIVQQRDVGNHIMVQRLMLDWQDEFLSRS